MQREQVIARLRDAMKQSSMEDVDWSAIKEETVIGDIGFDSLSILDLIYDVQQEFGLDFDAEELVAVNTVGELADFLGKQLQA